MMPVHRVLHVLWGIAVGILIGVVVDEEQFLVLLRSDTRTTSSSLSSLRSFEDEGQYAAIGLAVNDDDGDRISEEEVVRTVETLTGHHYAVQLYYHTAEAKGDARMPNITFVAHVTVDRIVHVRRWCRQWNGPMSISVFVRPFVDSVTNVMQQFVGDLCIGKHAHLHMVKELQHEDPPSSSEKTKRGLDSNKKPKDMHLFYPSNIQRNTALDGAVGDLVFLLDIDFHFLPAAASRRGEEQFRAHFEQQRNIVQNWDFLEKSDGTSVAGINSGAIAHSSMFVVPAIETVTLDIPIPSNVSELIEQVRLQQSCEFYGHYCKHCHHPTNLKKFLQRSHDNDDVAPARQQDQLSLHTPYLIDYEERYEPYVVLNKSAVSLGGHAVPRYNESFLGRFGDKFSFFYEIAAQNRPFVVMTDYYLVHEGRGNDVVWPNEPSPEYRARERFSERLFIDFKAVMARKYQKKQNAPTSHEFDATTTGRDVVTDSNTFAVEDPFLLAATERIDWSTVSSAGSDNWLTDSSGLACIATHRTLLTGHHNAEDTAASVRYVEGLRRAISWACENMDCAPLQHNIDAAHDAARTFPRNVVAHADWVFGRWMHHSIRRGGSVTTACHFNGAATLVAIDEQRGVAEESGGSNTERDDSTSAELSPFKVVGCTLNPDALVNDARLRTLIHEICSDPAPAVESIERMDDEFILGSTQRWQEVKQQQDMDDDRRLDRIGGGCQYLFQHLHPLVAHDVRTQAATALLAHHLIFTAGGRGRTCRDRFGDVATFLRVPR